MPNTTPENGPGVVWSVASANALIGKPIDEAFAVCAVHSAFAADIYQEHEGRQDEQPTHLRTLERFSEQLKSSIRDWPEDGASALPVPHVALSDRSAPRYRGDGEHRILGLDFDPSAKHLSTAVHRLRVVRLAIPEILRGVPPNRTYITPLKMVTDALAPVNPRPSRSNYDPFDRYSSLHSERGRSWDRRWGH